MINLRDFQRDCVQQLDSLNSAILIAPTGSGKTVMGSALAYKEVNRGGRVAFVVPRDNLARQTAVTMSNWGLNSGYILGGEKENRSCPVQILSYQSLGSKLRSLEWLADRTTKWLIDECHISAFAKSLSPYLENAKKIGLTATPWQFGGKRSLLDVFDRPVFAPPPKELIKRGYLAQPIYFCPKKGGKLNADPDFVFSQWEKLAYGEKTFVFAGSIRESDAIANYFQEQGITARSLTSKTPTNQVDAIFSDFKDGKITVLSSCNKLAEGCDIPTATVVILANRTESISGAIQRIGRGARIAPGKSHFKIIDCVGIVKKFPKFDEYEPSLSDFALKEPKDGWTNFKDCPNCFALVPISTRKCKCGHIFDIAGTKYQLPGNLHRLTQSELEEQAISAFHHLLIEDFKNGTAIAPRQFHKTFHYHPHRHWVADAELPTGWQSTEVNKAWVRFKNTIAESIPTSPIQLSLKL